MEIASKEALLSKDMNDADNGAMSVEPSAGDGMAAEQTRSGEENVDRIGDVDRSGHVYKANTDVNASSNYGNADHYNPETGELDDVPCEYTENSAAFTSPLLGKVINWDDEGESVPVTPKGEFWKDDGELPALSDFFTVGTGRPIEWCEGIPENPHRFYKVLPNSLFIDGEATQDDIRQGNVGDCYFLAAILQVLHYDPSTITKMMSVKDNGDVYTEFYHREGNSESGYHWVRKPVVVKWGETVQAKSVEDKGFHKGAHYRLKYDPEKQVKWSSTFKNENSGGLKISKTQYYQAAMWVQCLEHAYAGYAQLYGQYGKGIVTGGSIKKDVNNSYEYITGGSSGKCLHMFFGDDVEGQDFYESGNVYEQDYINDYSMGRLDEKSDLLDSSEVLLNKLTQLSQTQDGSQDRDMHIVVGTSGPDIGKKVFYFADQVMKELQEPLDSEVDPGKKQQLQKASRLLSEVMEKSTAYSKIPDSGREGESDGEQAEIEVRIHEIQESLMDNTTFTDLNLPSYSMLKSTMATLVHMPGIDMYMYTKHAYNIREVYFVGKDGEPLDMTALYATFVNGIREDEYKAAHPEYKSTQEDDDESEENPSFFKKLWNQLFGKNNKNSGSQANLRIQIKLDMSKVRELVDLDKSTAIIQNPHAMSKAVYPGEKESRTATGTWTTTLRDLLANVGDFTAVTVRNHRHDGDANGVEVTAVDGPEGEKSVDTE